MSNLVLYSIPAFVALLLLELAWSRRHPEVKGYETKDTLASLTMGLLNVGINAGTKLLALAFFVALYEHRIVDLVAILGRWSWLALLFLEDHSYYWFHRIHHEVRVLWACHVNPHSSQHYNLSTALRQPLLTPFTGCPLEEFMNTPSHHRVHHGKNFAYLDKNHGGIFIIYDRLFGTFAREREPVVYGLTTDITTFNPLRIGFHEFAAIGRDVSRAPGVLAKLGYVFAPPGWSHDGSTQTAGQLQRSQRHQ